jgi:hypothetical protein
MAVLSASAIFATAWAQDSTRTPECDDFAWPYFPQSCLEPAGSEEASARRAIPNPKHNRVQRRGHLQQLLGTNDKGRSTESSTVTSRNEPGLSDAPRENRLQGSKPNAVKDGWYERGGQKLPDAADG